MTTLLLLALAAAPAPAPDAAPALRLGIRQPSGGLVSVDVTASSVSVPVPEIPLARGGGTWRVRTVRRTEPWGTQLALSIVPPDGAHLEPKREPPPPGCTRHGQDRVTHLGPALVSLERRVETTCPDASGAPRTDTVAHLETLSRALEPQPIDAALGAGAKAALDATAAKLGVATGWGLVREDGRWHVRGTGRRGGATTELVFDVAVEPPRGLEPAAPAGALGGKRGMVDAFPLGDATVVVDRRGVSLLRGGATVARTDLDVEAVVSVERNP